MEDGSEKAAILGEARRTPQEKHDETRAENGERVGARSKASLCVNDLAFSAAMTRRHLPSQSNRILGGLRRSRLPGVFAVAMAGPDPLVAGRPLDEADHRRIRIRKSKTAGIAGRFFRRNLRVTQSLIWERISPPGNTFVWMFT